MNGKRTNQIGAGTKNVTGNVSEDLYEGLKRLAQRSDGVGVSTYAKCVLLYAVENSLVFENANEMKGRASNYRGTAKNKVNSRRSDAAGDREFDEAARAVEAELRRKPLKPAR